MRRYSLTTAGICRFVRLSNGDRKDDPVLNFHSDIADQLLSPGFLDTCELRTTGDWRTSETHN